MSRRCSWELTQVLDQLECQERAYLLYTVADLLGTWINSTRFILDAWGAKCMCLGTSPWPNSPLYAMWWSYPFVVRVLIACCGPAIPLQEYIVSIYSPSHPFPLLRLCPSQHIKNPWHARMVLTTIQIPCVWMSSNWTFEIKNYIHTSSCS
jgi:hypothetical protein